MRIGLIGSTGFVGNTILSGLPEAYGYNSQNISQSVGKDFDLVYCAAAPGSMFLANKNSRQDEARITDLITSLSKIRTKKFILISTIAVFDKFDGADNEDSVSFQRSTPYGLNRRRLEVECQSMFRDCLIVRLPALFGKGLTKNLIFDLMNPVPSMLNQATYDIVFDELSQMSRGILEKIYRFDKALDLYSVDRKIFSSQPDFLAFEAELDAVGINAINFHNAESTYQFYDLSRLLEDISIACDAGLNVIHMASTPLNVADISLLLTGVKISENSAKLHKENLQTKHADLWNRVGPYNLGSEEVKKSLKAFYDRETRV